jgi:TolB-like protein/tetratricopeptide (TPR) repeat protein
MSEFQRALASTGEPTPTRVPLELRALRAWNRRVGTLTVLVGVLASLLAVGLLAVRGWERSQPGVTTSGEGAARARGQAPTVAVLWLDAPADGGYIGQAFSSDISRRLGQLSSVRVLGPDATGPYRLGADRLERLARELRVTAVLEGAARPHSNRVALDLRLVSAPAGRVLWSFAEERDFADLPVLGGQLARALAAVIGSPVGSEEGGRVDRAPKASPGAYDSFLRATDLEETNKAQNEAGMDLLREAIRQDSAFALAWAALARRFLFHGYFVSISYCDSGMVAARRALELNPDLDEAHFVTGDLMVLSGRPATARYAFLKAIELNPSHTWAMADLSDAEATSGRFDESLYWAAALRWLKAGERRWPDFGRIQGALVILELKQGRPSAALARVRRGVQLAPTNLESQAGLAQIAWLAGAPDADSLVLVQYRAAPDARPYTGYTFRTLLAASRLRSGDKEHGRALADTALRAAISAFESGGEDAAPAVEAAAILALLDRTQESLDWLERAHQVGYRDYRWPREDPFFRALSEEPRFARLLSQMESEVAVMRRRAAAANDSLFRAAES